MSTKSSYWFIGLLVKQTYKNFSREGGGRGMQRKGATGSRLLLNFDCLIGLIDWLIDWLIDRLRCRFVTSSITFHLISLLYDKQRSSCRRKEGRRTSWWCDTIEMLVAKINVHSETNRLVPAASVFFRGVSWLEKKSVPLGIGSATAAYAVSPMKGFLALLVPTNTLLVLCPDFMP